MRLTVEVEGRPTVVEVADDLTSVRVGERSFPVRILAQHPTRVELEIGGETVVVDGWPDRQSEPPGPVDVNGERLPVAVRLESRGEPARAAAPLAPPSAGAGATGPTPVGPAPAGATSVVPPMPGRVVEVRVREGEAVTKGAVLLVIEAMKMRNEVAAPVDGVVRDVRVREGSSVRARETMLLIVPR